MAKTCTIREQVVEGGWKVRVKRDPHTMTKNENIAIRTNVATNADFKTGQTPTSAMKRLTRHTPMKQMHTRGQTQEQGKDKTKRIKMKVSRER